MWRKFGTFVTCVHISFKFGFKQPNYLWEHALKMFVVANCLGGVIEAGIQVEMCFLKATLFSILKIISEQTSYLSHQYVYQHPLNKDICIHSECRISVGSLRNR